LLTLHSPEHILRLAQTIGSATGVRSARLLVGAAHIVIRLPQLVERLLRACRIAILRAADLGTAR
jgi:hypothetical protein